MNVVCNEAMYGVECSGVEGSNNQDLKSTGEPLSMACTIGRLQEPMIVSCHILERD
jgi:hypothetical protein